MKTTKKIFFRGVLLFSILLMASCSLKEQILDTVTASSVQADSTLLQNIVYTPVSQLPIMGEWFDMWGLQEMCTDEAMWPTRGTDWYDGGAWQQIYTLSTNPQHVQINNAWNHMSNALTYCNTASAALLTAKTSPALLQRYSGMTDFMRTYYEYVMYDLWRIFPYRDPKNADFSVAPTYYNGTAGFNFLVSNAKKAYSEMISRDDAPYGEPNKDAALMLLAKLYLNKGVYTGTANYDSCLYYVNQIIATGHYALANDYFAMFLPNNASRYKAADDEAILVGVNDDSRSHGFDWNNVWVQPCFHYNQTFNGNYPSNWNGGATTPFYLRNTWYTGTDTAQDVRWKDNRFYSTTGVYIGFNNGVQHDGQGNIIKTRSGAPLNYTDTISLTSSPENFGVRILKYYPRLTGVIPTRINNSYIIWRYADVLLMKAECLARSTTQQDLPGAMALVNQIRAKRNAPLVSATTQPDVLNKIYVERGLELYWEGLRRDDRIRFGTFLNARTDFPGTTNTNDYIYPIPQSAIDGSNGSLHQNPGY
jgi:hypothetical protein